MIDFNKLIDNYFSRELKEKKIGNYYPSEIGGCLRKTWFSYKIQKDLDKEVLRIFEAGNNLHELITEILKSEKNPEIELLESELPFKQDEGEFTISGRIDNLILTKDNGKKIIIEVKSVKFLPNEAKESHIQQLQLYMHNLKVKDGIILYIQKDNLKAKWFNFQYSEGEAEEIIKRFHGLHHCLKLNIIPPAEAKLIKNKNWMCNYCEYKEECDKYPIE
ncbi:MAG: PD-(D/E)XK nuclease family protein [Candidatus Pacearchaeota archaeon]